MRLCILLASYEKSTSALRGYDPYPDPSPYLLDHEVTRCLIDKSTAVSQVRDLARAGYDAFINLCDGAWDEDRAGVEVPQTLERLGQAYTGARADFYDPTREEMKLACHYAGVDTPHFVIVREAEDVDRAAATLRFPLIVKHPHGYSSVGLTPASRVETPEALPAQVAAMIAAYGGALIEEFIEGREFTVLVAEPGEGEREPRAYPPVEARFPPGETFKHFGLKWVDYAQLTWTPVADDALVARLVEMSRALFTALHGTGYGRVDFRVDRTGRPYVLEINPNCGIFYAPGSFGSADEILACSPGGHEAFAAHLLACALRRRKRSTRAWDLRLDPERGWGIYARVDLAAGDLIDVVEERPHYLVTRRHVERTWDAMHQHWFQQYAWPLSDEVYVMWSDQPSDWRPVNHSCDPSAWIDGLNTVARRPIRRGEAVTLDYATFYGSIMNDFDCRCGATECRGVVRGSDHLADFVEARYGEHVSDYVRRARQALTRRS